MTVKHLPAALSGAIAALGVLLSGTAGAQSITPTFVQGAAFSTAPISATTVTLTAPVAQGDLLVGWFSEYAASGEVQVSDNVNGAWTRAPRSLHFLDDTGDIALYYRENSQAAPSGMAVTVSASSGAYLQGTVAEYSGVALAGSLDQIVTARAPDGTAVDTGATGVVGAGELVFAALVTSPAPGSVTPGSSLGVPYTARAQTANGSSFEEDITSSAGGAQQGTATLGAATDWYAVCAVFHPYPATPPVPPSTPTGLETTSVASTRVALSWAPSSGSVAGYTVYRDGAAIGTTGPDSTTFLDPNVTRATTYTYSVDAFDLANDHSARSGSTTFSGTGDIALFYREHSAPAPFGLAITLTASAPAYLQGAVADYKFDTPAGALDQVVVSQGVGTYATVGPTAPVPAGELVVAAVITGGQPGSATAGSSQMVPYFIDAQNGSASSDLEDILSSAGGPQEGSLTLGSATNWYMALATFRPLANVGLLGGPPVPLP